MKNDYHRSINNAELLYNSNPEEYIYLKDIVEANRTLLRRYSEAMDDAVKEVNTQFEDEFEESSSITETLLLISS